jgi:hypothetical protein
MKDHKNLYKIIENLLLFKFSFMENTKFQQLHLNLEKKNIFQYFPIQKIFKSRDGNSIVILPKKIF